MTHNNNIHGSTIEAKEFQGQMSYSLAAANSYYKYGLLICCV